MFLERKMYTNLGQKHYNWLMVFWFKHLLCDTKFIILHLRKHVSNSNLCDGSHNVREQETNSLPFIINDHKGCFPGILILETKLFIVAITLKWLTK